MINEFHAEHDPAFWLVLNDYRRARNVGNDVEQERQQLAGYSLSSFLVLLNEGRSTESIASTANANSVALIGRWIKTIGLPRDSNMARRRYSSINGPRI